MVKQRIATLLIGGLVLGGGAVALAETTPEGPSLGTSEVAPVDRQAKRAHAPGAGLLRRGIHGEVVVPQEDGTFDTVVFDKGTVTEVEDGAVSLERADGQTVTVATDGDTRYRGVDALHDLEVGRKAMVVSKDGTARLVAQRPES